MNKTIVKKIVKEVKNSIQNNNMVYDSEKILELLHTFDKNFEYEFGYFYLDKGFSTNITKKMLEDTHALLEYNPTVKKGSNDLLLYVDELSLMNYNINAYTNFPVEYKYSAYNENVELMLYEEILN